MDKSLADVISETRKPSGGHGGRRNTRGRGGGHGGNQGRRTGGSGGPGRAPYNPLARGGDDEDTSSYAPVRGRRSARSSPYSAAPRRRADDEGEWKRDMYSVDSRPARRSPSTRSPAAAPRPSRGLKNKKNSVVEIYNLSDEIEEEDFDDIFADVGTVVKATLSGNGYASVTFGTRAEAITAVAEYDKAKVEGRPMSLSLAVPEEERQPVRVEKKRAPRVQKQIYNRANQRSTGRGGGGGGGGFGGARTASRGFRSDGAESKASLFGSAMDVDDTDSFSNFGRRNNGNGNRRKGGGGGRGGYRRQGGGGRGNGGGNRNGRGGQGKTKREKKPEPSKDDLDAELDAYLAQGKN